MSRLLVRGGMVGVCVRVGWCRFTVSWEGVCVDEEGGVRWGSHGWLYMFGCRGVRRGFGISVGYPFVVGLGLGSFLV